MPFARRIRITVTNEGRRRVSNLYFHVDWKKVPSLPPGTTYFHARYRQALPTEPGRPYEILSVRGRGHYVGTVFSVVQNEAGWFGEGDERFYADGVTKPDIEGTGTEDYFNDAWSFRIGDGVLHRRSRRRWHRRRRPHVRIPLARRRSRAVPHIVEARHRASRLDVQPRGRRAIRVRGAPRSVQQRRVLVPGRHCERSARGALRLAAPAHRQRAADRGRGSRCGCHG